MKTPQYPFTSLMISTFLLRYANAKDRKAMLQSSVSNFVVDYPG